MRVLFCSSGSLGHLRPMLPLASALLRAGHRVGWASAPDALPGLAGMGADLYPTGIAMAAARRAYRQRWPEAVTMSGRQLSLHTFPRLFGAVVAPAMVDELGRVIDGCKPDLVIHEPAAFAAPLVCEQRRIAHICHGYGLRPPAGHMSAAIDAFVGAWPDARALPAADGGVYRHLYIDIAPRCLQRETRIDAQRVQPLSPAAPIDDATPPLADTLHRQLARGSRPIIYLSFGTVFNQGPALRVAARALSRLDATVVVTLGATGDARLLGPLPPNVQIAGFVDQRTLLPLCNAVVSHAGAGTLLGAAAFGLPQLLLPQAADQFRNAAALVGTGAGLALAPQDCTEDAVEAAARSLLASNVTRHAARHLADEIADMPTADAVALALSASSGWPVSPS